MLLHLHPYQSIGTPELPVKPYRLIVREMLTTTLAAKLTQNRFWGIAGGGARHT